MADQKVRVLVERLAQERVRLRFLSREDSPSESSAAGDGGRDFADHAILSGGVASGAVAQEALLASISLGHMQAYVALCARNDLRVEIYRDDAIATVREGAAEHDEIHVLLRPRLAFRGEDSPDARATAIRLLNEALGRSVFFDAPRITIEMEPVFEFRGVE